MAGKNIKFLEKSSVKLKFSKKLITPYGGFALVAKLFEKLELKEPIEQIFPVVETSPNRTGIYAKVLRFGLTVLAGGKRFSHGLFLAGSEPVQAALFGVKRLPSSSSALTRFFRGISSWQKSAALAEGLWLETFHGTEAAMLVRALFYNLITFFRQQALPQRKSRHTLQTLRLKYFVNAAVFG